jgi:ClpP class serine protease
MSFTDIFWVFLILSSLWPALQKRMLDSARIRLMHDLERKRGSRVISLIHRQETMALLGFPLVRYLNIEDSEAVLRAIKLTNANIPIDLILHTPGGLVLASEQIARALCRHPAKVTVFVPHYAMSGGTMIALAADEIVMDENAVLGPVDPQLGQQPAASVLKVLEQKSLNEIDDSTLILADVAEKAIRQVQETLEDIMGKNPRIDSLKVEELAELLSSGTWTHDYPITVEVASELGLPVTTEVPEEVYKLMALYRQSVQKRPSVSYIPTPYSEPIQPKTRR